MPQTLQRLVDWFSEHEQLLLWSTVFSAACWVTCLLLLPIAAARIPRDFFKPGYKSPFRVEHPVLGFLVWLVRNTGGFFLILAGIAMIPLPGPGMLVVLMGLLITTLPTRRHLARMVLRRRQALAAFNWLRRQRGAEPFQLSDLARRSGRRGLGSLIRHRIQELQDPPTGGA